MKDKSWTTQDTRKKIRCLKIRNYLYHSAQFVIMKISSIIAVRHLICLNPVAIVISSLSEYSRDCHVDQEIDLNNKLYQCLTQNLIVCIMLITWQVNEILSGWEKGSCSSPSKIRGINSKIKTYLKCISEFQGKRSRSIKYAGT